MASVSLYLRPDEFWQRGGTVTTTAGTTDSDYTDDWLVDDRANRPAKATNGTATWSIASSSGSISGVAVCHHNIDGARTITIGGGVTASGAAPAARPNGVPYNAWIPVSPVATGVSSLTVGVSSNSASLVIGEVVAGVMRHFPGRGLLINELSGRNAKRGEGGAGALSVNPYDNGEAQRIWQSTVMATASELDDLFAWFESQRNASKFSLFVPDTAKNDALLVELEEPTWSASGSTYRVTVNMTEIPRVRW